MAKYLAQIVVLGSQLVARAFIKSVRQEIYASQQAAKHCKTYQEGKNQDSYQQITLLEAQQILDVRGIDKNEITNRFTHLFQINEKDRGGSFYLQSKVYRAKERIDEEITKLEINKNKSAK